MTKPCLMFSEGRRIPRKVQTCGRVANKCWIDVNNNDKIPICDTCIENLNYAPHLIHPLTR